MNEKWDIAQINKNTKFFHSKLQKNINSKATRRANFATRIDAMGRFFNQAFDLAVGLACPAISRFDFRFISWK